MHFQRASSLTGDFVLPGYAPANGPIGPSENLVGPTSSAVAKGRASIPFAFGKPSAKKKELASYLMAGSSFHRMIRRYARCEQPEPWSLRCGSRPSRVILRFDSIDSPLTRAIEPTSASNLSPRKPRKTGAFGLL